MERDGGATKKTILRYPNTDDLKSDHQGSLTRGSFVEAVIAQGTVY